MADEFRTIHGIVQFDPKDGEAGTEGSKKKIRNITVKQAGFGPTAVKVSATLWPSHEHVAVEKGDVVTFEGKYQKRETTAEDGSPRVFHNVSVSRISVNGSKADEGVKRDTASETASEPEPDDDIPF